MRHEKKSQPSSSNFLFAKLRVPSLFGEASRPIHHCGGVRGRVLKNLFKEWLFRTRDGRRVGSEGKLGGSFTRCAKDRHLKKVVTMIFAEIKGPAIVFGKP